jgi:hypothetical protein
MINIPDLPITILLIGRSYRGQVSQLRNLVMCLHLMRYESTQRSFSVDHIVPFFVYDFTLSGSPVLFALVRETGGYASHSTNTTPS